ncbi:MAG: superoxide dismutase family protein [Acidobacteriaceae bacterium]
MRLRWVWAGSLGLAVTSMIAVGQAAPKEIKVRLVNSYGQDAGYAIFKTVKKGVKVKLELKNLRFGVHAVHIHENPVCDRPDFEGAGRHFNPSGKEHGFLNPMGHHNGDFPAGISIGEDHTGEAAFVLKEISLDPKAPDSLFLHGGTSIVVHVRQDDQKTDPSGDSGNRIACGVIQP